MQKNDFHTELNLFELHFPGRDVINFSNDEALQNFMDHQYPRWKLAGKVTSIPVSRVPRLFLTGDQMTKTLEERFVPLQKGETGETKVYKLLLETSEKLKDGICVLPNMDGNHFKSKEAHVELDLVVVHPKKGIFVLNIKNANVIKEKVLAEDMKKHVKFIRLLCDYNSQDGKEALPSQLPIHGIICSFLKDVKMSTLIEHGYLSSAEDNESRLLFQPADMLNFPLKWMSVLSDIPCIKDNVTLKHIDVLVARLAALNSMEGALALVHNKMTSSEMQKIYFKPKESLRIFNEQIEGNLNKTCPETIDNEIDNNLKERLVTLHLKESTFNAKKKRSVIVWTKEQLKIINDVGRLLLQPKGCRVIISGPKGCGKTMLLTYLAHLAKHIFQSRNDDHDGSVLICDGRNGASKILFDKLKTDFKHTGINVVCRVFDGKADYFTKAKLLLFDECNSDNWDVIGSMESEINQHVICFSSRVHLPVVNKLYSSYKPFTMTNTLRSTGGLVRFVEKVRLFNHLYSSEYPVIASHNLEGNGPDIRCISVDTKQDPYHLKYVEEALSVIMENLEKARGLKDILVTPFVHPITLGRILSELQRNNIDYEYINPSDSISKSKNLEELLKMNDEYGNTRESKYNLVPTANDSLPQIIFVTGNHVDGAEYGAVVVLLERSLPQWWDEFIFNSMFIAITRATFNLSIVIDNTAEAPMILEGSSTDNQVATPTAWMIGYKPCEANIPAYTFLLSPPELHSDCLRKVIDVSYWSKYPVLVVGKLPALSEFSKIDSPLITNPQQFNHDYKIEAIWFQGPYNKQLISLHIENLWQLLPLCILDDPKLGGFSAIVFIIHTMEEYVKMCQLIRRHRLLYVMYESQSGSCPMYMISPFSPVSSQPGTPSICDFIYSQNTDATDNLSPNQEPSAYIPPDILSWEDLKQQGTTYFKEGKLEAALTQFMKSMEVLKTQYDESVPTSNIASLIQLRDELAKLYTNISKVNFDIGMQMEEDLRKVKMETSFEYAVKSILANQSWDKGYHRAAEAIHMLGDPEAELKEYNNLYIVKKFYDKLKLHHKMKRDAVLKDKMAACSSWELVVYKKNVFLIDKNGEGHYRSIFEALKSKGQKSISLIINPGVYKCELVICNGSVDLVGNWDASLCDKNQWILNDPPVVIQNDPYIHYNTIKVASSTLSLSRISICNCKQMPYGHAMEIGLESTVTLHQCSFKAECFAAIACKDKEAKLFVHSSRSVSTYAGVLALEECSVYISNSFFHKVKTIGLEFRENVSANVDYCTITQCEGVGISCTRGEVNIKSCFLENNGYKKTESEGSVQLRSSKAVISDTHIQNQIGNGIVIESGSGRFEDVRIDRCQSAGILIQAPCIAKHCKITNCRRGIFICRNINGDVVLQDNIIQKCSTEIFRFPGAVKPIVNDKVASSSNLDDHFSNVMGSSQYNINRGKHFHDMIQTNRKALAYALNNPGPLYESVDTHRMACAYCTHLIIHDDRRRKQYFLCEYCETAFYCSVDCCKKDKEIHEFSCQEVQMQLEAYRKSTGSYGGAKKRTEEKHVDTNNLTSEEPTSSTKQLKDSRGSKKCKKQKAKKGRKKNW